MESGENKSRTNAKARITLNLSDHAKPGDGNDPFLPRWYKLPENMPCRAAGVRNPSMPQETREGISLELATLSCNYPLFSFYLLNKI